MISLCLLALTAFGSLAPAARADGTGDAAYQNGLAAAKAGHYAAAIQDYQQALLHGHNDPAAFYQLGLAY